MNHKRYMEFVKYGDFTKSDRDSKILGAMGLSGEAGEVSEIFKKHILHGRDLDMNDLKAELGDVLWYFNLILFNYDLTLDELMVGNVLKLSQRHGHDPREWLDESDIIGEEKGI